MAIPVTVVPFSVCVMPSSAVIAAVRWGSVRVRGALAELRLKTEGCCGRDVGLERHGGVGEVDRDGAVVVVPSERRSGCLRLGDAAAGLSGARPARLGRT